MSLGMAASLYRLKDSLFNLVSGLGTAKDPRQWATYNYQELDRNQLESMYRSDWLARRIVDLPADDATREWRAWAADRPKMEKIDALERKLDLQKKLRQALIRARLYGGGALVMGVDQGQPEDELQLDKVGLNDLQWVVVVNRYELAAGPRIYDVTSPYYTRPQYYTVATPMIGLGANEGVDIYAAGTQAGGAPSVGKTIKPPPGLSDPAMMTGPPVGLVQVHPSRIIEFSGNELPDWRLAPMGGGWGDSILQTVEDSLKDFAMIMGGLASMVNDMKMDVVSIPELSRKLSTAEMTQKTLQRFGLANMAKSSINTLLLDKDEVWQRIQTNFGSTPELIKVAMQVTAAAGGVPESRLMGNAPSKGLAAPGSSGGEVDIKNYYDDIASNQKSKYKPALLPLDICIQRSALGTFDPGIDYAWNPLYQPDPAAKAATGLVKAQTTQVYVGTGLINEDALRESVISQLTEDGVYPGLEDAIDEFGAEPEEPPAPQMPLPPTPPPGMVAKGAFEANPFHMLRAQAAAKSGQPIRVPPNRPQGPPKFGPVPPGAQPPKPKLGDGDEDDWAFLDTFFDGLRARGISEAAIRDMQLGPLARVLDEDYRPAAERYARDYDPNEARDPQGKWTSGGGGLTTSAGGGAAAATGATNYGLVPGDVEKYKALKQQWATVNNGLLAHIDEPDSPEAKAALDQLEGIVKQMHALHADPGTAAGIGLPGGPRDVTIVGAGPGGLAAGIFGGAEGLDTLVIDGNTVAGGQAKYSSRIENFPGFPVGVSGERLTKDMYEQAGRVGAETKLGNRVTTLTYDAATGMKHLTLANGDQIDSRAVILAGGVEFRKGSFPGSDGPGVVVGDGKSLTAQSAGGEAVVVGGSNGAAQAALGAATKASHVTLLSRSPIANSMSDYQIGALHSNPKVTVLEGDAIAKLNRDARGNPQTLDTVGGKTLPVKAVGLFLGSVPETDWLAGAGVNRDKAGKIVTNSELETNIPGVFAIGDMRVGAIGRIGVAVGEGQLALRQSHVYLESLRTKAGLTATADALLEDADDTDALISRLFDLDRANPWFGQTVEGVKPGQAALADYDPDQPRDHLGRWAESGGFARALGGGMALTGSTYAAARVAAQASRAFITSAPVQRGITAALAGVALSSTAAVGHETVMHTLKQGTEVALDGAITMIGSHLLGHAGLVAAGGMASSIAPVAVAVIAGVAVHKLAEHAGITDENSKKVLSHVGHFLLDHYQEFRASAERLGPSGAMIDAMPEDVVYQALQLLVPHWDE